MKHIHLPFPLFILFVLVWQLFITSTRAQWATDPNVNNVICDETLDQLYPKIVSDGSGGAIMTWEDIRNGNTDASIYVQRINSSGVVQWTANGTIICDTTRNQDHSTIASDGSGGAIITWADFRDVGQLYDIYAQRINSSGDVQWTANGVAICNTTDAQYTPTIFSDGSGNAIITWYDFRDGGANANIYAQKINSSGDAQWPTNGVVVCNATGEERNITIVSDGSGGAIITWQDFRDGGSYSDIYAQRIDSTGAVQWTSNGVEISNDSTSVLPTAVSDGSGGAIITWQDSRDGDGFPDIYAQRIDSTGAVRWTANGVEISNDSATTSVDPSAVSDGFGGAVITWYEYRAGSLGADIYTQRISSSGTVEWSVDGVPLCTATGDQVIPTISSDGSGGAIITWEDKRVGGIFGDIYAQKISSSGVVQWAADGVAISTASNDQNTPTIESDGSGGAIITWGDRRGVSNYDIYAQQVNANGILGAVTGINGEPGIVIDFALLQNYPNPFNPSTSIRYVIDNGQFISLKVYDVLGNEVATLVNEEKAVGNYKIEFNASNLSSGIYYYRLVTGSFTDTKKMILLK